MRKPSSDTIRCQPCAVSSFRTSILSRLIALGLEFISVVFRGCGRLEMGKASY